MEKNIYFVKYSDMVFFKYQLRPASCKWLCDYQVKLTDICLWIF